MSYAVDVNVLLYSTYQDNPAPVRGNLVPDAHLAALLIEHEVPVLYTADSDFARFAGIEVRNPFGTLQGQESD